MPFTSLTDFIIAWILKNGEKSHFFTTFRQIYNITPVIIKE